MVYFTCGACGEQVKMPQVEKHYTQKCRNCNVLTCIDCLKDFYGEEYKSHKQCMSEAQRYSKEGRNGWDPSQGQGNKGDKKQQEWMEKLRQLMDDSKNLDSAVRNIVNTIADHDNIPRKRPKFINFVKNIMRNRASMSDIEKTWDLFSQALQQPTKEEKMETNGDNVKEEKSTKMEEDVLKDKTSQEDTVSKKEKKKKNKKKGKENDSAEESPMETSAVTSDPSKAAPVASKKEKKCKKRKHEETMDTSTTAVDNDESTCMVEGNEEDSGGPTAKKGKFDWDATIQAVLAKKGNEMKLKKLRKKCVSEFYVQNPSAHQTPDQIGAKFDKKIKKRQMYKVVGEQVRLNTTGAADTADTNSSEMAEEASSMETNCDTSNNNNKKKNKKSKGKKEGVGSTVEMKNGVNEVAATDKTVANGNGVSFNAWEAANLGSDAQTEKFRRLMGIKSDAKPQNVSGFGVTKRDDRKLFRDLENGFEKARHNHFKAKGMGLGFAE